ncbi:helical backbone metal receptor [Aureisphaera galaxeae]|uniref:ABC transporter substrate-binding protein n=1 Tax=Aureisphaera galaxeae TaxID=1538023 RepID=UPI003010171E
MLKLLAPVRKNFSRKWKPYSMRVKDQLNRTLQFSETPKRIVSLVPSQTELLVHLGLRDRIVGVTKFCVHPEELRKEVKVVGGTKNVHFHKIADLQPDIIICNKEENTQEIVEKCEEIAPVWVSDMVSIEDSLDMMTRLGELLGVSQAAGELTDGISSAIKDFDVFMADKPEKRVAYLIWKKPYMAAGKDTFINTLLRLNRFENVLEKERYPEVTLEDMNQADLILLSSEPYPFKEKDVEELQQKTNATVRLVDGEYFSWYGSRLLGAFPYFKSLHT